MKNNIPNLYIKYKYNLTFIVYLLLIIIIIDNNSNIELIIKSVILFLSLSLLNKQEITKIYFIFYSLFFIFYFLFFILYFLVNNESSAHLANSLFILNNFLFLPMYIFSSMLIIIKNHSVFLKSNLILSFSLLMGVILPYFGFERGLVNMQYTKVDIFLFILIVLQFLIAAYFYKKNRCN